MSEVPKRDLWPLMLYEAVLSLYAAGPDDAAWRAIRSGGGRWPTGLRLSLEYDELLMMSSGDNYQRAHHLDERHTIEIERTWLLPKTSLADFVPQRNQRYVLEIVWNADGQWYRRTYSGRDRSNRGLGLPTSIAVRQPSDLPGRALPRTVGTVLQTSARPCLPPRVRNNPLASSGRIRWWSANTCSAIIVGRFQFS
jgi:hypothetical protein